MLTAAAPQLSGIGVYEAGHDDAQFLSALAAPLRDRGQRPDVISISLGDCEPDVQKILRAHGIRVDELALAEDAAAGITVVAATGDTGSTGCEIPSSLLPEDVPAVVFPASSPHVVSVGGTNVTLTPDNRLASEIVWNDAPRTVGSGGGGCSVLFARPAYQAGHVPTGPAGCASGPGEHAAVHAAVPMRAMPDVSMLVDEALRAAGRPPLGEAAPLMYRAEGTAFDDVTRGNNDLAPFLPGADHRGVGCCRAHRGYDLASGLGSIDLARFAQVAASTDSG